MHRCGIRFIVFIRSNPIVWDPRVEKEVQSLTTHGFKVTVLAWDREGRYNKFESYDSRVIYRLRLSTPYDKLVVVAYYPFFWLWTLLKLLRINPTIIHACDLDTIFPALFYRFLRRKTKVIFDAFDTYTLLIQEKSKILGKLVRPIELLTASRSNAFITVSKERLNFFNGVNLRLTEIIMNYPPDCGSPDFTQSETNTNIFRIVYTGAIAPHRGLIELAETIKDIDDIELIIAGRVIDPQMAEKLNNYPYVRCIGPVKFDEALVLERSADLIPLLYDLEVPINKVAAPNKLFEALMLGVPIITNLRDVLSEVLCGVKVDYNDISGIKEAIVYLKDHPQLRHQLGLNGRIAFEQKYNWSLMERKLIKLYSRLLNIEDERMCMSSNVDSFVDEKKSFASNSRNF